MAYADRLRRALYGLQRQFQDTPDTIGSREEYHPAFAALGASGGSATLRHRFGER